MVKCFVALGFLVIFNIECFIKSEISNDSELRVFRINSSLPTANEQDELVIINDTMVVYFYKDLIGYQIPVLMTYSSINTNSSGDILGDSLLRIANTYKYFVYKKGDSLGFMYNGLEPNNRHVVSTDSFLKSNTITNFSTFLNRKIEGDSMIGIIENPTKDIRIEKYVRVSKGKLSDSDSTYLYFTSTINKINFSYSPELEKMRGMKLFKVRIIFNPKPGSQIPFLKFHREILFGLSEIKEKNKKALSVFFKKIENDFINSN